VTFVTPFFSNRPYKTDVILKAPLLEVKTGR